jgi:2-polyprenyl-3-methyl-5-hydroxy-6-metoxy-1,4-benzoquinol methylase
MMTNQFIKGAIDLVPVPRPRARALDEHNKQLVGRVAQLEDEIARLAKIEAAYNRWREVETLIEPLMALDPAERLKIMSTDQGLYGVGTQNAPARDAWVEKTLKALPKGLRLLDAGAGECQYKKHCAHLTYVAQDVAVYDGSGDVGFQNPGWSFEKVDIICDIVDIPQPDASFDAVLCTEVLEHLPDPVRALDEMSRLLRPGGMMIITAPFWSMTHQAPFHFATGFNRFFYEHHLARLGFDIVELTPNGNYFESIGQEVRRIRQMATDYAGTQPTALEQYAIQIVLALVDRCTAHDTGSTELLHYGYHLRAVKRA